MVHERSLPVRADSPRRCEGRGVERGRAVGEHRPFDDGRRPGVPGRRSPAAPRSCPIPIEPEASRSVNRPIDGFSRVTTRKPRAQAAKTCLSRGCGEMPDGGRPASSARRLDLGGGRQRQHVVALGDADRDHAGHLVDVDDHDLGARPQPALGEVLQELRGAVRDAHDARGVARRQGRQRGGRLGDHHAVAVGDGVAVRVAAGLAELGGDAVLEPLRDVVLQAVGLRVHLVPGHAEVLDEVELEQPVVAQHLQRDRLAARRQAHAVVRLVGHQPQPVEALDHAR